MIQGCCCHAQLPPYLQLIEAYGAVTLNGLPAIHAAASICCCLACCCTVRPEHPLLSNNTLINSLGVRTRQDLLHLASTGQQYIEHLGHLTHSIGPSNTAIVGHLAHVIEVHAAQQITLPTTEHDAAA